MRPVREDVYDTAPMRPMNIRSGYEGYRRTIDRRREVIRTERPVSGRVNSRKGKKERTSGRTRYENRNSLSALIARQRSAAGKEQYFDYDLLFVIFFLMCFGLVMLYSVSFYEAQADFGNDTIKHNKTKTHKKNNHKKKVKVKILFFSRCTSLSCDQRR